jgi:co-chaperonin GroES (HSP10)
MIQPVLDYIVVKVNDAPMQNGIHMPYRDPSGPKQAEVLAVGPGRPSEYFGNTVLYRTATEEGLVSPVKVGQTILFHGGAGTIGPEGNRWILPRDVMGILPE